MQDTWRFLFLRQHFQGGCYSPDMLFPVSRKADGPAHRMSGKKNPWKTHGLQNILKSLYRNDNRGNTLLFE